jgi:hypothetical protein
MNDLKMKNRYETKVFLDLQTVSILIGRVKSQS